MTIDLASTRTRITIGILVVVMLALGLMAVCRSSSRVPMTYAEVPRWLACSKCNHAYKGVLVDRPGKCPECGENNVWYAKQCVKCGRTVAIDTFKFDAELRQPYCPECGSRELKRKED